MTQTHAPSADAAEALLGRIAGEFTDRLQRGEAPDVEEYARRHPELAEVLRQVLPALQLLRPAPAAGGEGVTGTLGDFRIIREVGRGGMGVVYEAEQISLGRRVALKVLPFAATMDPKHLQRFHNEARAAASLHHEHIVPVFAVGCERGVHYYAMQFIEGRSLAEVIAGRRGARESSSSQPLRQGNRVSGHDAPLTPPRGSDTVSVAASPTEPPPRDPSYYLCVAGWGVQASEALEYAHSIGVVHRDVKPANLLVDERGKLWVADFGLARAVNDAGLTMTGDLVGTLRYMSPEQALAKHSLVDPRADVYSLGASLYELLALVPAFAGADRQELLRQIAFEETPPLRRRNAGVPTDLETIVTKAMAKEPAERYATASELADDLRNYLDHRPIRARRASLLTRLRKWRRRHRAAVTTALLSLVLFGIGAAAVCPAYLKERSEAVANRGRANDLARSIREERYDGDVRAAGAAWKNGDPEEMRLRLDRHQPRPGEEDLRGFEWHYLRRLAENERRMLRGHWGAVYYAAFSPDGRTLATASQDATVKLWNVTSGHAFTLAGHTGEVNWVSWSPDGKTLVSASDDRTVKLWDAETRRCKATLPGHTDEVVAAVFSPDGSRVATGGKMQPIRLWDAATGKEMFTLRGPGPKVESLAFSPNGRLLVSAHQADALIVWDLAAREAQWSLPGPLNGWGCQSAAFSPDGKTLATGCADGAIRFWEAVTWRHLRTLAGHRGIVQSVAWSPDGQGLVSGSDDRTVRHWDSQTGSLLRVVMGQEDGVWCVAYSPDAGVVASTGRDHTVRLHHQGQAAHRRLYRQDHTEPVYPLAFTPRGDIVATGMLEGAIRRRALGELSPSHLPAPGRRWGGIFSADGRRLLTHRLESGPGSRRREWSVWDLPSGRQLRSIGEAAACCTLAPDGGRIAIGTAARGVEIQDATTGELATTLDEPGAAWLAVRFSNDGRRLAAATDSGEVRQWDVRMGRLIRSTASARAAVLELAFSPDDRQLAGCFADGVIRVMDSCTGELAFPELRLGVDVGHLTYSPDGRRIAAATGRTVRVWSASSGRELLALEGVGGSVRGLAFSPDGRALAAQSDREHSPWVCIDVFTAGPEDQESKR